MRIEQLQAFLAVAETGSFQQAAQKCAVTQSTISRQVQGLESALGLPLFHRTTQAKLTIGGERFLPRARKICQEWQNASQELTELLVGKQQELCIAAIHSVCGHFLPPVLQQFCQDYPDVQLRVTALGSDRALKVLKDGLVDLVVVMNNRFLTASAEMVVDVLCEEHIEVLMAANHPLAKYDVIPWDELALYPQVMFKDGYGMQRIVQEQFAQRGLNLHVAMELNTPDAFRGVIRRGKLVALLPQSALCDCRQDPLLTVRSITPNGVVGSGVAVNQSLTRQVVVVTTKDRLQIPPVKHFYKLVRELLPLQYTPMDRPVAV